MTTPPTSTPSAENARLTFKERGHLRNQMPYFPGVAADNVIAEVERIIAARLAPIEALADCWDREAATLGRSLSELMLRDGARQLRSVLTTPAQPTAEGEGTTPWVAFPGRVPVCRDCGTDWKPVRRGECVRCGSDAGPIKDAHVPECNARCDGDVHYLAAADVWVADPLPGGYVCADCGMPTESEPCAEHQLPEVTE